MPTVRSGCPRSSARVHAVIDAGAGPDLDHIVLEAMACGRAVLSSRPALTPTLAGESLPLVFATGDAISLAACITAVADARQDELADLGDPPPRAGRARALARPVGRGGRGGDRGVAGPLSEP